METAKLLERNQKIAENGKKTREKRAFQDCKTFDLKIVSNKLNLSQKEALTRLFLEAKWLYNSILASENINKISTKKQSTVPVKVNDSVENREIKHLGSHHQQSILQRVKSNIKSLSTQKQNGRKVGRIRFVKEINSLDLKQYGVSYKFKSLTKVKLQGIPGEVRVRGAEQLTGYELANARIVRRPSGYHLLITAFKNKPSKGELEKTKTYQSGSKVGLDMGVKTHITLSNGEKHNVLIGETERLKRLQRKLSKQVKGSNNYNKTRLKVKQQYEKMSNQKSDAANKLVHKLLKEHETVFVQDENLRAWVRKNGWVKAGRKLHHSILGRVKAKLVAHNRVTVLKKWVATTQSCRECGVKTKHSVDERMFNCSHCGFSFDRDIHAALNMVHLGLAGVGSQSVLKSASTCGIAGK